MIRPGFSGHANGVRIGPNNKNIGETPLDEFLETIEDGFLFSFGDGDRKGSAPTRSDRAGEEQGEPLGAGPPSGDPGQEDDTNSSGVGVGFAAAKPDFAAKGVGNGKNAAASDDDETDTSGSGSGASPAGTEGTDDDETSEPSDPDADVYVSGLDTPDGYNIEVIFAGTWADDIRQGVIDAVELISDYVTGDLPDVGDIDDLQIVATMGNLNGYWGYGGFTSARADSYMPTTGYLQLDNAGAATALENGILDDLAFHEILHTMGFGLNWDALGLVDNYGGDLRFNGTNAIEAYHDAFYRKSKKDALSEFGVPIETDGGAATAGKHWDESTFRKEIMTGQLNWTMNITDLTIGALEDMGYETTYGDDLQIA